MSDDTTPATDAGTTKPAGEGLSDEQMSQTVAEQTSPDLDAEDVFEREADGTETDAPVSEAGADDLK
jgi:hypothetical protein